MEISPGILKNTTIDTQLRPLWYFPPDKKILNVEVFFTVHEVSPQKQS